MIAALLTSLGINIERLPFFGSTVIFELHGDLEKFDSAGSYRIRTFYLNDTETESFHRLQLPGCPDPCTVERFVSFIAPQALTREELEERCKLDWKCSVDNWIHFILMINEAGIAS